MKNLIFFMLTISILIINIPKLQAQWSKQDESAFFKHCINIGNDYIVCHCIYSYFPNNESHRAFIESMKTGDLPIVEYYRYKTIVNTCASAYS